MTPLDIAIRLIKQGDGAKEAEQELRGTLSAAQLLADESGRAQQAQAKWNATLAQLDGASLAKLKAQLKSIITETEAAGGKTDELKARLADVQKAGLVPRLAPDIKSVGEAAKKTGGGVREMVEQMRYSAIAGRVLSNILRGELFAALSELPQLLKAVWLALRANPLGLLLGAITALGAAFVFLREKLGWFKKEAEALPESLGIAQQATEEFARVQFDLQQQRDELEKLRNSYEQVEAAVDRLRRATDTMGEAKLAVALADIDLREQQALAQPQLDDNQRAAIRLDFAGQRGRARQAAAEDTAHATSLRTEEEVKRADERLRQNADTIVKLSDQQTTAEIHLQTRRAQLAKLQNMRLGGEWAMQSSDKDERELGQQTRDLADKEIAALQPVIDGAAKAVADLAKQIVDAQATGRDLVNARALARQSANAAAMNEGAVRKRGEAATLEARNDESALAAKLDAVRDRKAREMAAAAMELDDAPATAARQVLARVRFPQDLDADKEEAVFTRAQTIHRAAQETDGRQLGETMGEAVGLALREMFPQLTAAYLQAMRDAVQAATATEVQRLEGQIKAARR